MKAVGGIHLFVGGIGADGHIAFNEPASSLTSRTRIKTLTLDTKVVNSRFFGGDPDKVPATALTVGVDSTKGQTSTLEAKAPEELRNSQTSERDSSSQTRTLAVS